MSYLVDPVKAVRFKELVDLGTWRRQGTELSIGHVLTTRQTCVQVVNLMRESDFCAGDKQADGHTCNSGDRLLGKPVVDWVPLCSSRRLARG